MVLPPELDQDMKKSEQEGADKADDQADIEPAGGVFHADFVGSRTDREGEEGILKDGCLHCLAVHLNLPPGVVGDGHQHDTVLGNRNRAALVNEQSATAVEFGVKPQGGGVDKNSFDFKGELHDVLIENITAKDIELPVIIAGFKEKGRTKYVKNITLKNISLEYRKAKEVYDKRSFIPEYAKQYPECWRFRNLPAYAIWARHAKNISVESFSCTPARSTWKQSFIFDDVK